MAYYNKKELLSQYKNNMLIPMDIGITLGMLSLKNKSNFSFEEEIEVIEEFANEYIEDSSKRLSFMNEVYEYYCK